MAEHHTCDRCGGPVDDDLATGSKNRVWIGPDGFLELDLKCLNELETWAYGKPMTRSAASQTGGLQLSQFSRAWRFIQRW